MKSERNSLDPRILTDMFLSDAILEGGTSFCSIEYSFLPEETRPKVRASSARSWMDDCKSISVSTYTSRNLGFVLMDLACFKITNPK